MRFLHSLPGHKGKVPGLFDKTIDEYGETVLWDNNLKPRTVPKLIKKDGARIVFANSEEEAYEMTKKNLERDNSLPPELRDFENYINKYGLHKTYLDSDIKNM